MFVFMLMLFMIFLSNYPCKIKFMVVVLLIFLASRDLVYSTLNSHWNYYSSWFFGEVWVVDLGVCLGLLVMLELFLLMFVFVFLLVFKLVILVFVLLLWWCLWCWFWCLYLPTILKVQPHWWSNFKIICFFSSNLPPSPLPCLEVRK